MQPEGCEFRNVLHVERKSHQFESVRETMFAKFCVEMNCAKIGFLNVSPAAI